MSTEEGTPSSPTSLERTSLSPLSGGGTLMESIDHSTSIPCAEVGSLFSFGVVGDVQYADCEDGTNYSRSVIRRHRQSIQTLVRARDSFRANGIGYTVLLGDILDGKAGKEGNQSSCLDSIMKVLLGEEDSLNVKDRDTFHLLLGNHDFYCFTREELYEAYICRLHRYGEESGYQDITSFCSPRRLYYSHSPHPAFRFVYLDSYDVSTIGASSAESCDFAWSLLEEKNKNMKRDGGSSDWFKDVPLENIHYVPYNGALGDDQLSWLEGELRSADEEGQLTFVFSHVPCHPSCCDPSNLMFNHETVLRILQNSNSAVAFIAGHDHNGGYTLDDFGIHHIVAPSPLECSKGEPSFGHVELFTERMVLHWTGKRPVSYMNWPDSLPFRTDLPEKNISISCTDDRARAEAADRIETVFERVGL